MIRQDPIVFKLFKCRFLLFLLLGCLTNPIDIQAQDAETHHQNASDLYDRNQRDSAITEVNKAIRASIEMGSDTMLLRSYVLKSVIYRAVRPLPEADALADSALVIARRLPFEQQYFRRLALFTKAQAKEGLHEYDSSIFYLDQIRRPFIKPNDYDLAKLYVIYAWTYTRKRDLDKALEQSKAAYELMSAMHPKPLLYTTALQIIHSVYNFRSQFDSALSYALEYLKFNQENYPAAHPNIGIAHNDVGTVYQNLRQYQEAQFHRLKCEEIFYQDYLKNGQSRLIAVAWSNLGFLYSVMNESYLAEQYVRRSLHLMEQEFGPDNLSLVLDLLHLGSGALERQEFELALAFQERALNIQQKQGAQDQLRIDLIRNGICQTYALSGQFQKADSLAQILEASFQAQKLTYSKQTVGLYDSWAVARNGLGDSLGAVKYNELLLLTADSIYPPHTDQTLGAMNKLARSLVKTDLPRAEKIIQQILEAAQLDANVPASLSNAIPAGFIPDMVYTYLLVLQKKQFEGREIKRLLYDWMTQFIGYLTQHLGSIKSEQSVQQFSQQNKGIFSLAIQLLMESELTDSDKYQIFKWSDDYRSLILKLQANRAEMLQSPSESDSLEIQISQYERAIQMKQLAYQNSDAQSIEHLRDLGQQIESYAVFKDSLRTQNHALFNRRFRVSFLPRDYDVGLLSNDENILQYTHLEDRWVLCLLNKEGVFVHAIEQDIVDSLLDAHAKADVHIKNELQVLFQLLVQPILGSTSSNNWLIIPDDKMFYLNFEELVDDDGKYLIETLNLRYAYSFSAEYQSKQSMANTTGIQYFAPGFDIQLKEKYLLDTAIVPDTGYLQYLHQPFMLALAQDLSRQFNTDVYLRERSTEANFKLHNKNVQLLHFATHGELDDQDPLYSKLVFAKEIDSSQQDGYLHTYEIYGMQLPAQLAILSACETGKGKLKEGEGVVSLAHAFFYAGCPAIITSLWKIDEKSSSTILQYFYRFLAQGMTKSAALRRAKLDYLEESVPELRDPSYWAGLILIGNNEPIPLNQRSMAWLLWLGLFLLVGMYLAYRWRRMSGKT